MSERLNNYNEHEMQQIIESQRRRIHRLQVDVDEARDIAKQLLFELRTHCDTPATHASFHWLREDSPPRNSTREVSDE